MRNRPRSTSREGDGVSVSGELRVPPEYETFGERRGIFITARPRHVDREGRWRGQVVHIDESPPIQGTDEARSDSVGSELLSACR